MVCTVDGDMEVCKDSGESVSDNSAKFETFEEQWERIKDTDNKLKQLYIDCVDLNDFCTEWASMDECNTNLHYMARNCRKSCGECTHHDVAMGEPQLIEGTEASQTFKIWENSVVYKRDEVVAKSDKYSFEAQLMCINNHQLCAFWAAQNECEANPVYMEKECSVSCGSCLNFDTVLAL